MYVKIHLEMFFPTTYMFWIKLSTLLNSTRNLTEFARFVQKSFINIFVPTRGSCFLKTFDYKKNFLSLHWKKVLCWNLHFHKIKFWFEFYIYKFISYLIHFSLFYFQRVEINMLNVNKVECMCVDPTGVHTPPLSPVKPHFNG